MGTAFFVIVSAGQLLKTPDAAELGAVAALVRACMAWVCPQAKSLRKNCNSSYNEQ